MHGQGDTVMRLLLLSNSTNFGGTFLGHATDHLGRFLGGAVRDALFVPYAAVRVTFDEFAALVADAFAPHGCRVRSVHREADPLAAVRSAGAIVVGGGNTFQLLAALQRDGLLGAIRDVVTGGTPYIGWSAGANVASPTICTTNDMPIVEPSSFEALGLVPFQINPHYTPARIPDHGGESRVERLLEFTTANPAMPVVALPEGTMLEIEPGGAHLHGSHSAVLFRHGHEPGEIPPGPVDLT
jgi:dipeptidase E